MSFFDAVEKKPNVITKSEAKEPFLKIKAKVKQSIVKDNERRCFN